MAVNSRRVESLTRRAEEWRHHKVLISVARTRHGGGLKAKSDEADAEKGESSGSGTAVPIVVEAPSPCQVADAKATTKLIRQDTFDSRIMLLRAG